MRRILLFSGPLTLRGTSVYTVSLARELKLRGHKVAVMTPGGTLEGALEEQDVSIIRAPVRGSHVRDLLYLNALVELTRDFDPEIVHTQSHPIALVGSLLARAHGAADVVTVHTQVTAPFRRAPGTLPFAVAVSEDVRQALVTSGQFKRERIEVISNGVSASLSALEDEVEKDDLPVVGAVGRLAAGRGVDTFLQAARRVLDQGGKAHFIVIGEGPEEAKLRALTRSLNLTANVTFSLPRARIADLFRPLDIYVSAGESEGHGILTLCAMAEARAVLCTGVGGVLSFMRDGENGLLVQRGDPQGVAQKIMQLLANPSERRRLGHEALHHVREHFSLSPMVEATVSVYERVLAEAPVTEVTS